MIIEITVQNKTSFLMKLMNHWLNLSPARNSNQIPLLSQHQVIQKDISCNRRYTVTVIEIL